jgi:hypothetical protein
MPGLLDFFNPQDPAKQQGLLSAAAALLQAGGPSRLPISTAQGIGAALGAYQQGTQDYQDRDLRNRALGQSFEINDIKLQDAKSDLANQQLVRERDARVAARVAKANSAQQPAQPGQQTPATSVMYGGSAVPTPGMPDWMRPFQQQPTAPAGQAGAPRANMTDAVVQRMMVEAQARADEGDANGAAKLISDIQKLRPKFNTTLQKAIGVDGKLHYYQASDDGSPPQELALGVAPDLTEVDLGGTKQFVDKNAVAPGQVFKKTMTFADQQSAARLAFDKSQASSGDDASSFTAQAIDNAAARYNTDGSLPPMGMGAAAATGRTKILNRAAELKAGVDPVQQRLDQLNNKGDVAARNAAVRSFGVGKDGQAVQSANTALNHLDTIRQLAIAQKSGDVRAFNQVARSLGAQFGQTAPTNLNAALIMVAPEVSKAVIGAGGTGHERDEAIKALNPNGSPDQIISGTGVMQELFGGRLTEAKRTYERTTKLKDFDSTMLSPAAQAVLSRAEQHTSSGAGAPGPAASKVATLSDIAATARASGRSTAEVTAALRAKGYTIGGQ